MQEKFTMLLAGIHIHFFSESSAGQVSLMAYLPSYNLGWLDKSAELYRIMVKKTVCNLSISDKHFTSILVPKKGF